MGHMTAKRLVLVPLDGSEPSETAIPMARSIFRTGDMAIAFVHVRKNDPLSEEELRDKLGLSPSDHVLHAVGDPAKEICRISNEHNAWVIVMSTQAETASREDRFGSTLAEVIVNTDRAVVVVR